MNIKEESFLNEFVSQGRINEIVQGFSVNTPPEPPIFREKNHNFSENDVQMQIFRQGCNKNINDSYKEESFSNGFVSQGIINEIVQGLATNTPPEPPVYREKARNFSENDVQLQISRKGFNKNINDSYKISDYNDSKLIYVTKDSRFQVDLSYLKLSHSDFYIRIYPSSTDLAFKHNPIICCSTHVKAKTKVNVDQFVNASKSIFEIHDSEAKYEPIELGRHDEQVSVLVKYMRPNVILDLVFKCYNTCQSAFRKHFPKLHFAIEQRIEANKYAILSETSFYFKVCASPARDSKSMSLKKRHSTQNIINQPQLDLANNFVEINSERYFYALIPSGMLEILQSVRNYADKIDPGVKSKIEAIEKSHGLGFPQTDIDNDYVNGGKQTKKSN